MKIWQKGVEILSIFDSDPQRLLSVKIIYIQLLTQRGMPQINVLRPVQDGNKFLYFKSYLLKQNNLILFSDRSRFYNVIYNFLLSVKRGYFRKP